MYHQNYPIQSARQPIRPPNIQPRQSNIQPPRQSNIQQSNYPPAEERDVFRLTESRTRDIIDRLHKLQNDINETKIFLRTRLGAPDASRLKDIMKQRLAHERFAY